MRQESMKNLEYAKGAEPNVLGTPVQGKGYRGQDMPPDRLNSGLQYGTVIDSSEWNEMLYRITSFLNEMEKQGGILWSPNTDYKVGCIVRNDAFEYLIALKDSGPSYGGAEQPVIGEAWELATFRFKGLPTGTSDVVFVHTSEHHAEAGQFVVCDNPCEVFLPLSPNRGDRVAVATTQEVEGGTVTVYGKACSDTYSRTVINAPNALIQYVYDSDNLIWQVVQSIGGYQIDEVYPDSVVLRKIITDARSNDFVESEINDSILTSRLKISSSGTGLRLDNDGLGCMISEKNGNSLRLEPDGLYNPDSFGSSMPPGFVFASSIEIPEDEPFFLPCDGRAVDRIEYPYLFEKLGYMYGNGDGDRTFNIPDFRGYYLHGSNSAGVAEKEGLPALKGWFGGAMYKSGDYFSGADGKVFKVSEERDGNSGEKGWTIGYAIAMDASKSNQIYGRSEHVTPTSMSVIWYISTGPRMHLHN